MVVGRAIFGVGAEQFHTSRKWLLFEYFAGAEYYFASGLSLSFSRLASASQSYISSILYRKNGVVAVLSVGWILVIFSLCLLILFFLILRVRNNKNSHFSKLTVSTSLHRDQQDHDEDESSPKCKCKCYTDKRWWLLGLNLVFFYSAYLSYSNVGSAFLQSRYQFDYEKANQFAPIAFWISAVFTPVFGFFCDFYGKRTAMMLLSGICLLFGHGLLGFVGSPLFGLMLLGFGYSLGAAAMWPSFGLIVKQKNLAMTLGIWGSIDNAFQASMSLCVGALTKDYDESEREMHDDQYDNARYLWIGLSLGMILWTLMLWAIDVRKYDNALWKRSGKFDGAKLSDLLCERKENEVDDHEMKKVDDEDVLDGKTQVVGMEDSDDEDELLVGDATNDQVLGISGFTAYDL